MDKRLPSITEYVPEIISNSPQWVGWRYEERKGKITKPPLNLNRMPLRYAKATEPSTWCDYAFAKSVFQAHSDEIQGLGFVLTADMGLVGIDIDHCAQDGELSSIAKEILTVFEDSAYAELSPSGEGVHLWLKGEIPYSFNNRKLGIEMYSGERYLTFTGKSILPQEPRAAQETISSVFDKYCTAPRNQEDIHYQAQKRENQLRNKSDDSDEHILELARNNEKFGQKFSALFDRGDFQTYYGTSQSEADLWVCGILAFFTDKDCDRIDSLFRSSALYRKKWDDRHGVKTYGQMTIDRAIQGCSDTLSDYKERQDANELKKAIVREAMSSNYADILSMLTVNKQGTPLSSRENIRLILENDERLRGLFRFNELSYSVFCCGCPPWKHPSRYFELRNVDFDYLANYLEEKYLISSDKKILSVFSTVCHDNSFNPLIEHLESLPEWDGRPHIEKLLPDWLGAELTELNTEMMRVWMLGAVYRAYEAGSKFDLMLVLVGDQGVGKSYFLSQLAMSPLWFSDNLNTIEGDKGAEKLRGMWILEMGELLAMKRAKDVEAIKAFITSRVDNFRTPYARLTESHPRRCVFAATTNERQFLTDNTGNRRFLPIAVDASKAEHDMFNENELFTREIEQAWAEALHLYKTEHPQPILSREMTAKLESVREERFSDADWREGFIRKYLNECLADEQHKPIPRNFTRTCTVRIWEHLTLKFPEGCRGELTRKDSRDIGQILRRLGCVCAGKVRFSDCGAQQGWDYYGENVPNSVPNNESSVPKLTELEAFEDEILPSDENYVPF